LFNHGGHTATIGVSLQQAVEKYLKGYLIGKGWELIKTHNIPLLLAEASKHDARFTEYFAFGRELSEMYVEDKYPASESIVHPLEKMREMIEAGERLIGILLKSEAKK